MQKTDKTTEPKTAEDPLDLPRFSYTSGKSGLVQISFEGRTITQLKGRDAEKFLRRIETADTRNQQLIMAKTTGHFKHGNERLSKQRR